MSRVRDELFEQLGRQEARAEANRREERLIASLILHEGNMILGCRIRIEWVDEKPPFADAWARSVLGEDQ